MKKTENPASGAVHWLTSKKHKDLFFICLCGMVSGLVWTKADEKKVTCRKCLSMKKDTTNGS